MQPLPRLITAAAAVVALLVVAAAGEAGGSGWTGGDGTAAPPPTTWCNASGTRAYEISNFQCMGMQQVRSSGLLPRFSTGSKP